MEIDFFSMNFSLSLFVMNRTVRLARNVAEKQRRDKLNSYINELANSVPIVANATKRLDKTSILRLSAAFLRLHNSKLHFFKFGHDHSPLNAMKLIHIKLLREKILIMRVC